MPLPIDIRQIRKTLRALQKQHPDDLLIQGKCAQLRENAKVYAQDMERGEDTERVQKMMAKNWNELARHMQRNRYKWPT